MGIRPVQRIKHIIDAEGTLAAGTNQVVPLATVVNAKNPSFQPVETLVGESINGFFISLFVIGDTGAPVNGSINWFIAKAREGQDPLTTFGAPGNTGITLTRNQIFHEEKGLVGSGDGTAMAFKGVIAVPRGMRRQREGDELFIKLRANGNDSAQFCLKAIYNSYS